MIVLNNFRQVSHLDAVPNYARPIVVLGIQTLLQGANGKNMDLWRQNLSLKRRCISKNAIIREVGIC